RDLVIVGLTRAPLAGLVVLAPLIAYGEELGFLGQLESRLERSIEEGGDAGGISWSASTLLWIIALLVVVTVLGAVLQVLREVIQNWKLSLYRTPSGLRRTAGLFTTTSRSSTVRRVQAISTDDSPLQRWMGITHFRLRTFGSNDISLPGTRPHEVDQLRAIAFGTATPAPLDRRISRAAVFLAVRNTLLFLIPVGVAAWFTFDRWALLGLVLVPIRWATAERRWQLRRWSLVEGRLAEVRQLLARHMAELPLYKSQVVTVSQSFFERRRGLATLSVRSADGSVEVPLIPLDQAQACRDVILHAVETDRRPFL
ncbi:MAG: PH domain-containing protein, partial [Ilumatobacter sp.]|nr:PH domain-containing protein [Ilumatobacter sp.]